MSVIYWDRASTEVYSRDSVVELLWSEGQKFGKTNGLGKEESIKGLSITYNS